MQPVIRTQQSRGGVEARFHKWGIAAVAATCCISLTFMGFASEAQAGPRFGRAVAIGIGAAAVLGIAGAAMANQRRPVATAKPSGTRSGNKATASTRSSTKSSTKSASRSSSKGKAEDVAKVQPADSPQVVPVKPPGSGEPNSALSYTTTGGSGPQGPASQTPPAQAPAAAQPGGGASVAQTPAAQSPSQGAGAQGAGAKPGDRTVQSAQAPSNLPLPVSMVTEIGE